MTFKLTLAKLAAFLLVTGLTAVFLTLVLAESRGDGDRRGYSAAMPDASLLKSGDDVRIAGVPVGKVDEVAYRDGGGATIGFHVPAQRALPQGVRAVVRYKNLLGDRYLELQPGPGPSAPLADGATIPASQTAPAVDLDVLVGGFKPLFRALNPDQVNQLSANLLAVLQGQGGAVRTLLASISSLTSTLADRDQLIDSTVTHLNTVLGTLDRRGGQVSQTLTQLQQLTTGLAADRGQLTGAVDHLNGLAADTAGLVSQVRPDARGSVDRIGEVAGNLNRGSGEVNRALAGLGPAYDRLAGIGVYGDFFNFFLCDLRVKTSGPNAQPIYTPWVNSQLPRCTGRPTGK